MKTLMITAACVWAGAPGATAATPTWTLHPDDTGPLKAAGLHVSYQLVVNDVENPEYAFTITAQAPAGVDSLDAFFSLRNNRSLVAMNTWQASAGKCVAFFTVGKQALKDASFWVDHYRGTRDNPGSASGSYVLFLSEFAHDGRFRSGRIGVTAPPGAAGFRITAPIERDGPILTVRVTPVEAFSNHSYDLHITVSGRSEQHLPLRSGQPVTRSDVRLADLNGDGRLDIMITGVRTTAAVTGTKPCSTMTKSRATAGSPPAPTRRRPEQWALRTSGPILTER